MLSIASAILLTPVSPYFASMYHLRPASSASLQILTLSGAPSGSQGSRCSTMPLWAKSSVATPPAVAGSCSHRSMILFTVHLSLPSAFLAGVLRQSVVFVGSEGLNPSTGFSAAPTGSLNASDSSPNSSASTRFTVSGSAAASSHMAAYDGMRLVGVSGFASASFSPNRWILTMSKALTSRPEHGSVEWWL